MEQRRHLLRRFQIPLGVRRQPPARADEIGVMVNAGEDVEERPIPGRREPDAARRDDRHMKRVGQIDERLVVGVFVAPEVPLHFHEDTVAAEHADEPIDQAADAEVAS